MRYLKTLLLASVLVSTPARADSLRDALDDIADAIDRARDDGGRCKRRVVPALKDARSDLRDSSSRRTIRRALRDLGDALDDAEDCGRRVSKRIRSARRALRSMLDDNRDDRAKPVKKKKLTTPSTSWSKDCIAKWFMYRLAEFSGTDGATLKKINTMGDAACGNSRLGKLRWPNGGIARTNSGKWYYPNGGVARTTSGKYYYPNGGVAKTSSGKWYYPNGGVAVLRSGKWYFPNGNRAGGWQAVKAWACGSAPDKCSFYEANMSSNIGDWRTMALVAEAWLASKR